MGLAIYLAGRLTCVPTGGNDLKLLVLDDVLIGIDLTNRLPLLDLLQKRFSNWQIVLLTHDKNWFDIAALYVEEGNAWTSAKIYEGSRNGSFSAPVVVPDGRSEREIALGKATKFANQHEYQAAANYARSAYEATLRVFSDRHSVPVPFEADQRHPNYEAMLGSIETWMKKDKDRIFYATRLERTKIFRRIILNPLSHADTAAVEFEVRGAVKAVKALDEVVGKKFQIDPQWKLLGEVRNAAAKANPTDFDLQMALANLRAKFAWSLRQFCEKHSVEMPFKIEPPSTLVLWQRVYSQGPAYFTDNNAGLETQINNQRDWLIDEIDRTKLPNLTLPVLQQLITLLNPNNDEKTVLDTI